MESVTHGVSIRRRLLTDKIISHRLLCIQSNKTTRREVRVSQNLRTVHYEKQPQSHVAEHKIPPKQPGAHVYDVYIVSGDNATCDYSRTVWPRLQTDLCSFACATSCTFDMWFIVINIHIQCMLWLYSSIHGHKMNGRLNPVQIMYMYDGSVTNESYNDPTVNALELLPMYCRSTTDRQSHLPMKSVHALSKL